MVKYREMEKKMSKKYIFLENQIKTMGEYIPNGFINFVEKNSNNIYLIENFHPFPQHLSWENSPQMRFYFYEAIAKYNRSGIDLLISFRNMLHNEEKTNGSEYFKAFISSIIDAMLLGNDYRIGIEKVFEKFNTPPEEKKLISFVFKNNDMGNFSKILKFIHHGNAYHPNHIVVIQAKDEMENEIKQGFLDFIEDHDDINSVLWRHHIVFEDPKEIPSFDFMRLSKNRLHLYKVLSFIFEKSNQPIYTTLNNFLDPQLPYNDFLISFQQYLSKSIPTNPILSYSRKECLSFDVNQKLSPPTQSFSILVSELESDIIKEEEYQKIKS